MLDPDYLAEQRDVGGGAAQILTVVGGTESSELTDVTDRVFVRALSTRRASCRGRPSVWQSHLRTASSLEFFSFPRSLILGTFAKGRKFLGESSDSAHVLLVAEFAPEFCGKDQGIDCLFQFRITLQSNCGLRALQPL